MGVVIKKAAKAVINKEIVDNKTGTVVESDFVNEAVPLPLGLQGAKSTMVMPSPDKENPNCEVGFDAGYTHNLGNYSSCRFGVSLKIDCEHSEIDEVFEYATEWVNGKMSKLREELES